MILPLILLHLMLSSCSEPVDDSSAVYIGNHIKDRLAREIYNMSDSILPKHLSVHSLDSNISLSATRAGIQSSKSRVEISEKNLNATVRSNSSIVHFEETAGNAMELSAIGRVRTELYLSSIEFKSASAELEVSQIEKSVATEYTACAFS